MVANNFSVRALSLGGNNYHEWIELVFSILTIEGVVSGGFAVVQPNSVLSVNAVEGYALEDFSAEAVRNQISEAQKIISGSGSEYDKAEAEVELEVSKTPKCTSKLILTRLQVLESLQAALK